LAFRRRTLHHRGRESLQDRSEAHRLSRWPWTSPRRRDGVERLERPVSKGLSGRVVAEWHAAWSACVVIDHSVRAGPIGPLRRSLECVKTLCQTFPVRLINASSG
jgi:hypothetical protein